jgi:hypothetical protein
MARQLHPWFFRVVLLATLNANLAAAIGGDPTSRLMRYGLVTSLQCFVFCVSASAWMTLVGASEVPVEHALDWTVLRQVAPSGCFYPGPRYNRAILVTSHVGSSLL